MPSLRACPSCQSKDLRTARTQVNGEGLPGLGSPFLRICKIDLVLCAACGHLSLFASPEALAKLPTATEWSHLDS